jgi:heat shock protein HtpX
MSVKVAPVSTADNDRKALLLLAAFAVPLLLLGLLLWPLAGPVPLIVLAVIAGAGIYAATAADRIVLSMLDARPASPDEQPRYANLVEGLCLDAELAKPRLLVVEADAPNALAVGSGPERASLVVTTGLLERLNLVELEGVLAHELDLIRSHAIRPRTLAVVLGGLPALLWHRGPGSGRIAAFLAAPLAPLLLIADPFESEVEADERGALLTRYPPGLISALTKVSEDPAELADRAASFGHLWLVDPAPTARSEAPGWLRPGRDRTPVEGRVEELREL